MVIKKKQLSSPFSTGSGGAHFEAHIQSSFVILMLSGGYSPALPTWPISEIKLQGKVDGYETDDLIVFVQNKKSKEKRKLLGQVKHSINFTKACSVLTDVMKAAWSDFNNSSLFSKNKDCIALITGPLKETDFINVTWILDQAKYTKDVSEFFSNVNKSNFSPTKAGEKLDIIRHHLKISNNEVDVPDSDLYEFLNHFYLLGYDLGKNVGVVLSLLHSHISQFDVDQPKWVWSRVVDTVQTWNQSAGTITLEKLPEDLKDAFKTKVSESIPSELAVPSTPAPENDWNKHKHAASLVLTTLIGSWDEGNKSDVEAIRSLIDGL